MKSKGYKIVVGALVAIVVVLGGLVAFKTLAPAEQPTQQYTSTGKPIPEGAMEDPTLSSPSSDDGGAYAPADGNVA